MNARKIHQFRNELKIYDDHLIPIQRERYRRLNVHEAVEEDIFVEVIREIPAQGCFVAIGAAIGYYAILAKLLAPTLTIYAIEPLKRHRAFFRENVALNGFHPTDFIIRSEGIACSDGVATFVDNDYSSAILLSNKQRRRVKTFLKAILVRNGIKRCGHTPDVVAIKTITLDSLMNIISRPVDLIQMDVQGLEANVLQGAAGSLRAGKIKTFLIGTHGPEIHQHCIDILKKHGYVIEFEEDDPKEQPDGIILASKATRRTPVKPGRDTTQDL